MPSHTSSRPARPEDVAEICLALPEAEATTSWGDRPTYAVRTKGFVLYRGPRKDAVDEHGDRLTDVILIRTPDLADKEALVQGDGPFFTTDHFTGYAAVLLRESEIGRLSRAELAEVITDAWLSVAPKRLAKAFLEQS